jgi:cobalt-precorrin 5A hydrolase
MDGGETMIVAGIGCRSGCPADDILALLSDRRIAALAAPIGKCGEPGLIEAATRLGLPLIAVSPEALAAAQPRCVTLSARALRETGVASVAEGCALAAAGPASRLLGPRSANARATCALAERGGG